MGIIGYFDSIQPLRFLIPPALRSHSFCPTAGNTIEEATEIYSMFYSMNNDKVFYPPVLIGGGVAWFVPKHGRNRNIGSLGSHDVVSPCGQTMPGTNHRRELLVTFGGPKVTRQKPIGLFMLLKGTFRKTGTGTGVKTSRRNGQRPPSSIHNLAKYF